MILEDVSEQEPLITAPLGVRCRQTFVLKNCMHGLHLNIKNDDIDDEVFFSKIECCKDFKKYTLLAF